MKLSNFEKIKAATADDLAEWFSEYDTCEMPWDNWFQCKYCDNCEPIKKYCSEWGREAKFAYCELHDDQCKFFPEFPIVPDQKYIIKLWLNSTDDNIKK